MKPNTTRHIHLVVWRSYLVLAIGVMGAAGTRVVVAEPSPEVPADREGITWTGDRPLPRFAPHAKVLDAIDVASLSADERITFSALQGLVNAKQPRIFLLDSRTDEGRDTWWRTPTVSIDSLNEFPTSNKWDMVAKYVSSISGVVLYHPGLNAHFRNLASTVAGLRRALPVTDDVYQALQARGLKLEIVADLRELPMTSAIEIYEYLYQQYWPQCEKRFIISARPDRRGGDHHHTRDLAVACGAAVVWLDCRIPEEREVLRKFLGDMQAGNAVVLGWYTTERSGITTASEFGVGTLPADHYLNATVYSAMDPTILIPPVPSKPPLKSKVYVALFISDGDNIQYAQRAMRRIWDRSSDSRGKAPMNWTIAPGLVDIGPAILNYYYSTATPNDCFVGGPSGMGYTLPFNTLAEPGAAVGEYLVDPIRMDAYASLTDTYLQRAGLRVLTVWDSATPMQRASYERNCRHLYGITVHNFKDVPSVRGSVEGDRLRFEKLQIPYVGSYEHLRRSLREEIERWDGKQPRFLAYQISIWQEMKPARIVQFVDEFAEEFGESVTFVRADHYFALYNEAHGLPFNLTMNHSTSIDASSSRTTAKFVGDGTPVTSWSPSTDQEAWVEFEFDRPYSISRLVIRHHGAAMKLQQQADDDIRKKRIEVNTGDNQWQPLERIQERGSRLAEIEVVPTASQRMRITWPSGTTSMPLQIEEIEVFGKVSR